jgi:hypothetical protein
MNRKYRSWIPGIVFWILFLASLALSKRHWWIDTAWNAVWFGLLLVLAVASVVQMFRNRHDQENRFASRGVPRWAITMFGGEVESPDKQSARRNSDS